MVSLVIPCWCESERLPPFLHALAAALNDEALPVEILVVEDGSPDDELEKTARVVASVAAEFPAVKTIVHTVHHRGKGGAVYWGWQQSAASAVWLAMVDADGAVPVHEVIRGIRRALENTPPHAIITATRYHSETSREVRRGWIRQRTGAWFADWAQRKLNVGAVDSQCGFKLVPASWWRNRGNWREEGYAFYLELLVAARDDDLPIENLAIEWSEIGESNVTWWDGWSLIETVKRLQ
ncbi:MAG: glycosyltransferase [Candidatus Synoicihabitans palmerolidicus]|nr:glycosyltransferase [Candidatus Synoicihabitans palmerolidicus]